MAVLALVLLAVWLLLVAGLRTLIQLRRTGEVSVPRFRDRPGSPQWWARLLSSVTAMPRTASTAPAARTGVRSRPLIGGRPASSASGAATAQAKPSVAAQLAMGASWRPDVDPDARTALVTNGPFRLVRNPIFTATTAAATTGLALLVPNLLAAAMLVAFVTALQIQVRLVEEPYLHRVHGTVYDQYAARTGRFLPWIGRQRTGTGPA